MNAPLRIGGACAFWGDSDEAARQLVERGGVDVLVFDYLAEVTMSLLARARMKDASAGWCTDFVSGAIGPIVGEIARRGVRVVSNAGGMNPLACRDALAAAAAKAGVRLDIAAVTGDDLAPRVEALRLAGHALPPAPASLNVYLGAQPVACALDAGAQVVITGRCVDSAVTLGTLMHAFRWRADDWDRLAMGSLCGHLLECGAQATGGNFTDWQDVPGWHDMGYPVAECDADGSFVITKPAGTGGLVTPATVGEQLVYEIGDPAAYALPDVICDFRGVTLAQDGEHRVRVRGARGRPPSGLLKASVTVHEGWRATALFALAGMDAAEKGRRVAGAILERCRTLCAARGLGDFRRTALHLLGTESIYGSGARPPARAARELVVRLEACHDRREAMEIFSRETVPPALSMAPGTHGRVGGRPAVAPMIRLQSGMIPATEVPVSVHHARGGIETLQAAAPPPGFDLPAPPVMPAAAPRGDTRTVPLVALAWARSGDKGDDANIGVIARRPEYLPWIKAALTPAAVREWFAHLVRGEVERHDLPGMHALNFVLHETLDGGGTSSLASDPQAKTYAQILLEFPVAVPRRRTGLRPRRGVTSGRAAG